MKLFIRRDISDCDSGFTVFDELGYERYYACLKKTQPALRLEILDTNKDQAAKIRQIPVPAVTAYSATVDKKSILIIIAPAQNTFTCHFYGVNWHVCGNLINKTFSIIDVDNSIIATHKKSFGSASAESFELEVFEESNSLLCLCAAVCVDLINTVDKLAAQAV